MGRLKTIIALNAVERANFLTAETRANLIDLLPGAVWFDPTESSSEDWEKLLAEVRPEILITAWSTPAIPVGLTDHLRYICHVTGSVRALIPRELLERGVKVSNWGSVAAPMVAEHALLLTLAALRNLPAWPDFMQRQGIHDKIKLGTRTLFGRRVSIHGFGLIARELLALLKPFRTQNRVYSAGVPVDYLLAHQVEPAESLAELCRGADIFICCEALSPVNHLSLTHKMLSLLAPGAVFVNVGRGALVDEVALAEVAATHGLRVANDVFTVEPLPLDSPLHALPGSLYSPHVGGPTIDEFPVLSQMAVRNIRHFLANEPLDAEVTLDIYDRAT